MIGDSSFHSGSASDGLADSRKVVVHEMQGNGVPVILKLLTVASGQARETAHILAHRLVMLLHERG